MNIFFITRIFYFVILIVVLLFIESKTNITKSPVKKAGPKGPASQRKPKARGSSESVQSLLSEERKCPLENCDSMGHLGGKLEKHFTIEACPMYHNRTIQACKVCSFFKFVLSSLLLILVNLFPNFLRKIFVRFIFEVRWVWGEMNVLFRFGLQEYFMSNHNISRDPI